MKRIILLSLKEVMSKKVLHLGFILTIIYLLVFALGFHYVVNDPSMRNEQFWIIQGVGYQFLILGWYISSFLAGALAIMMGAGSISREIETSTILGLASRPLSRGAILGGKFIAYSLLTSIYTLIMAASVFAIVKYQLNLLFDPARLAAGMGMFMLCPIVLLAAAHLLSSLFSTMATGVSCFMLFAVAMIGGFVEEIGAIFHKTAVVNIGVITSLLMPSDAIYRMAAARASGQLGHGIADYLGPFGAHSEPSIWMLVYTIIYIIIMLLLAIFFFNKRDL